MSLLYDFSPHDNNNNNNDNNNNIIIIIISFIIIIIIIIIRWIDKLYFKCFLLELLAEIK